MEVCGLRALDHAHDVFLAHDEELFAFDFDCLAAVLAEQHAVANLDVERRNLAVVVLLAFANGDDLLMMREDDILAVVE